MMERRRVVHYVKSRTIHGYTPPSKVRPVTPSSVPLSPEDRSPVAPLATIESDTSVESKGRSGQSDKFSSLRVIRRPKSEAAEPITQSRKQPLRCLTPNLGGPQRPQSELARGRPSLISDSPEFVTVTRPSPELGDTQKAKWQPRNRRVEDKRPLTSSPRLGPKHFVRARDSNNSSPSLARNPSSVSSDTPNQYQNEPGSCIQGHVESRTDLHTVRSPECTSSKNTSDYSDETELSPCPSTDSSDVFHDACQEQSSTIDPNLTESQQLIFQSPLYKPFDAEEEGSWSPNPSDSHCSTDILRQHDLTQARSMYSTQIRQAINSDNSTVTSSVSPAHRHTSSNASSRRSDSGIGSDREFTSELRVNNTGTVPTRKGDEINRRRWIKTVGSNKMEEANTEPRAAYPSHIIRDTIPVRRDAHVDHKSMCRDKSEFMSPQSTIQNAASKSCADRNYNIQRNVPQLLDNTEMYPDQTCEFKSPWKRNSMRLATQGYASMSDLTNSVERLQLNSEDIREVSTPTNAPEGMHSVEDLYNQIGLRGREFDSKAIVSRTESGGHSEKKHINIDNYDNSHQPTQTHYINGRDAQEATTDWAPDDTSKLSEELVRSPVKRRSFRLATTSIADVWLLEEDYNELMAVRNQYSTSEMPMKDESFNVKQHDISQNSSKVCFREEERSLTAADQNTLRPTQIPREDSEEQLNTIKRRSFMLATSSISDLRCDIDDTDFGDQSPILNSQNDKNLSNSENMGSPQFQMTPDSLRRRPRGSSFSSGRLNSSFGSFYSCQSTEPEKASPSPVLTMRETKPQWRESKDLNYSPPAPHLLSVNRYSDNYDSISGDTSFYTANNTSFRASDSSAGSSPRFGDDIHRSSPRVQIRQWSRKSPYTRPEVIPVENSRNRRSTGKSNSLPNKGKSPKVSRPLNMFHCYGCGVEYGYPNLAQRQARRGRNNKGSSKSSSKRREVKGSTKNDHKRSQSTPPSRGLQTPKHSNTLPEARLVQRQISADSDVSRSHSYTSGAPRSPQSGSITFFEDDPYWQDLRRGPPSLGRPRRKLYAGFDSQPLPMGSFISDSSSAYSEAMSCSSRGGSRSVELERSNRSNDFSDHHSSNKRAVSSSASGGSTPNRRMSGDGVYDYFNYTDKRSSLCENNHNLYISHNGSYVNSGYKDNFSEKNFSNDSLNSFNSDATATNVDRSDYFDFSPDSVKPPFGVVVDDNCKYNNSSNNSAVFRRDKRTNEFCEKDRLNNSGDSEFGSRLSYSGYTANLSGEGSKSQQEGTLKASSSASSTRQRFPSKLKYFSSKDILDLLITPEKNAVGGATSLTSLEKQAQKVCKVILCCNEMEQSGIAGKEYHF